MPCHDAVSRDVASASKLFQQDIEAYHPDVVQTPDPQLHSGHTGLVLWCGASLRWKHAVPVNPNFGVSNWPTCGPEPGSPQHHVFLVRGLISWLGAMTQHDFVKVRDRSDTNRWRRANSLTELIYGPVRIKYDGRNSGAGQGTHQYTNAVHLWLLYVSGYLRHFVTGPPPSTDENWVPTCVVVRWEDMVMRPWAVTQWFADAGLPTCPRPFQHRTTEVGVSFSQKSRAQTKREWGWARNSVVPADWDVLKPYYEDYYELFALLGYLEHPQCPTILPR